MKRNFFLLFCIIYIAWIFGFSLRPNSNSQVVDVWIQNGIVLDGLGQPPERADIFILKDSISFIGTAPHNLIAKEVIDATGKVVTPGFIDPHSHGNPLKTPKFQNFTAMGVTTIALGQDGSSTNISELFNLTDSTKKLELGPNIALFVGHGTIRKLSGIGFKKNPSKVKIQQMVDLLEDRMESGAFGLTTGLEYTPGRYAGQYELDELAKTVGKYGGIIMSHMRTENDATMESDLTELFRQGNFANIHVSHMKVVYGKGSDRAEEILHLLNKKRNESSFKVSADVYPYLASHTTIGILFPEYALAPNHYETVRQSRRNDLLDYIKTKVNQRNGPTATLFGTQPYIGKTLKQVADEMGIPFEEVLVDHIGPTGASAAYFTMDKDLQNRFLTDPYVMLSSDGSPTMYHPRGYGSFAKMIEKFVVHDSLLTLEEAVRKMTSLPAQLIGIKDRGILRKGYKADILIFDPKKVRANATFESPHVLATGFDYVLINGSQKTGNGKLLKRN